jgi:uncharacterized protein
VVNGCPHDKGRRICYAGHMETLLLIGEASWNLFRDAAVYVLCGFLVAGMLRALISPEAVVKYFRRGRFRSVLNASLIGIPLPL